MEYIGYIIVSILAFLLGWHLRFVIMLAHLSIDPARTIKLLEKVKEINAANSMEELEQVAKRQEAEDGEEISIERVGDMLYAYAKESGQFLAQGASLADVLEAAHKRFPNQKFFGKIAKDDPAKELA